jgi:cyclophilin family peptidyl-prolyl cis-trans isomerase
MQIAPSRLCRFLAPVVLIALLGLAGCGSSEKEQTAAEPGDSSKKTDASTDDPEEAAKKEPLRVKILTSAGALVVELEPEKTPLTVANFLRYVDDKFYDNTLFHEAHDNYLIIGGIYTPELDEKPAGQGVWNEADRGLKNLKGTITMTRDPSAINSATSSFCINLVDNPHFDHKDDTPEGYGFCAFGRIVEGMDVAEKIGRVKTETTKTKSGKDLDAAPTEPVIIRSIRRL